MLRLNSARLLRPYQLLEAIRCLDIHMLQVNLILELGCCLLGIYVLQQELPLLFNEKVILLS